MLVEWLEGYHLELGLIGPFEYHVTTRYLILLRKSMISHFMDLEPASQDDTVE